jgi:hypothetical protein
MFLERVMGIEPTTTTLATLCSTTELHPRRATKNSRMLNEVKVFLGLLFVDFTRLNPWVDSVFLANLGNYPACPAIKESTRHMNAD